MTGAAEFEAAGLYDPAAPDAADRLALLEYLVGVGATMEELAAADSNDFALVASRVALWGPGPRLTLDEVAAQLGVERSTMLRTWRAAGFPEPEPDAHLFAGPDVEMFRLLQAAVAFFGEDVVLQLMRVLGASAARIADASISAFFVNVVPGALERDPSGLELARANTESIALVDGLTRGFDALIRHHLEQNFRTGDDLGLGQVDLVRRSVGFADLVGSTSWTQQLDFITLSHALSEFESRASEVVVARRGRMVKLIGDEVMFVAEEPGVAADIALALIDEFSDHAVLPPVRAGIATGDVVARDGDYSGAVVNLASRALSVAEPSTLMVDRVTAVALTGDDRFVAGIAREHDLKGFDAPVSLVPVGRAG